MFVCVILVLGIGIAESMASDDKQTKKRTTGQGRAAEEPTGQNAPDCGRYVVCMLYSFINYTDF